MPEGDTIHRTAATLARAIAGATVTGFELPRRRPGPAGWPQPGERLLGAHARGKHLLMGCSGGLTLHTHMRMSGSWHVYRPGERWRRTPGAAVVRIDTPEAQAVCFSAPVVEVLREDDLRRHPVLTALGPDLCLPEADLDEAMGRLDALDPSTPIAVALLDQTVAAGVGNVYRSEVAWACRLDPFRPVRDVAAETRRALYGTAGRLLRANLDTPRRTTVPGGLAVYDRAGRACPRCSGTILTRRLGEQARSVWWCPGCQR
jgi:endonuclease VIII